MFSLSETKKQVHHPESRWGRRWWKSEVRGDIQERDRMNGQSIWSHIPFSYCPHFSILMQSKLSKGVVYPPCFQLSFQFISKPLQSVSTKNSPETFLLRVTRELNVVKFNVHFSVLTFLDFSGTSESGSLPPLWNTSHLSSVFGCFIDFSLLDYITNSSFCLWLKYWRTEVSFRGSLLYPHSLSWWSHPYFCGGLHIYVFLTDLSPEVQIAYAWLLTWSLCSDVYQASLTKLLSFPQKTHSTDSSPL